MYNTPCYCKHNGMELENLKQQAQSELAPTTTLLEDVCGWMVTNFSLVLILLLTTRINIVPPFFFLPSVLPFLRNVLLLLFFFFFPPNPITLTSLPFLLNLQTNTPTTLAYFLRC